MYWDTNIMLSIIWYDGPPKSDAFIPWKLVWAHQIMHLVTPTPINYAKSIYKPLCKMITIAVTKIVMPPTFHKEQQKIFSFPPPERFLNKIQACSSAAKQQSQISWIIRNLKSYFKKTFAKKQVKKKMPENGILTCFFDLRFQQPRNELDHIALD